MTYSKSGSHTLDSGISGDLTSFWLIHNASCFYNSRLLLLTNPVTIHTMIKTPPRRKRVNELLFRSPNMKKLGASEYTKIKYPPKASNKKAESKIIFLKNPISTNQLEAYIFSTKV